MNEWTVGKEVLENALKIVTRVPTRNGISSSEFIKLESTKGNKLKMSMNSDIGAHAYAQGSEGNEFELSKPFFVDRRLFVPFVDAGSELKEATYSFGINDSGKLVIKHGQRKGYFDSNTGAEGYSDVPKLDDAEAFSLSDNWVQLVTCAQQCAAEDPVVPQLNCVYMVPTKDGVKVLATDTKLAFSGVVKTKLSPKQAVAFPLLLINSLKVSNEANLEWTDKVCVIKFGNGRIWQAVKVEARKNFPKDELSALLKESKSGREIIRVGTQSLHAAGERLSQYLTSVHKDEVVLTMEAKKDAKQLFLLSGTTGSNFREDLKLMIDAQEDVQVEWPLSAVMPILEYTKKAGEAKILLDQKGHTCFTAGNISVVIAKRERKGKKNAKPKEAK